MKLVAAAVVLAACLISGALVFATLHQPRYQAIVRSETIYRIDNRTGLVDKLEYGGWKAADNNE